MTAVGASSRLRSRSESSNLQGPKDVTNNSREEETKSECRKNGGAGRVNTVAIVGAGFSGLVLANYLEVHLKDSREQHGNEKGDGVVLEKPVWSYKLFESKPSSGIPVIGTICLESAREVLKELRLFEEACSDQNGSIPVFPLLAQPKSLSTTETKNDDRYQEVSRESFLELLRKNAVIQSSSRVVDILKIEPSVSKSCEQTSNPEYYVVIESDERVRVKHGPFNLVVASNGLSFRGETTKSMQQTLKSSKSILKIGDCRYRYGRPWWQFDFLGMTRRKSGADAAIRDGLEVGRRLVQCDPRSGDNTSLTQNPSSSYQNNRRILYQEKVWNLARIVFVVLVPILLALAFHYKPKFIENSATMKL